MKATLAQAIPKRPIVFDKRSENMEVDNYIFGRSYPMKLISDSLHQTKILQTLEALTSPSTDLDDNIHKPTSLITCTYFDPAKIVSVENYFISKNIKDQINFCQRFGEITSHMFMSEEYKVNKQSNRTSVQFPIAKCGYFMHDSSGIFGVVQAVSPLVARNMPDLATEVAERYGNPCKDKADRHWCRAVAVLWGSMIDQRTKYGVLTSYERTWFFTAYDEDCLTVSDAVHCDQPNDETHCTLLQNVAGFMCIAREDCDDAPFCFPVKKRLSLTDHTQLPFATVCDFCTAMPRPSSDGSSGIVGSRKRRRSPLAQQRRMHCRCSSLPMPSAPMSDGDSSLNNDLAVAISAFNIDKELGGGRMGLVFGGTWRGESVAVKLVDSTEVKQCLALRKELAIYKHLSNKHCEVVPKVVEFNVTSGGNLMGFAIELLEELPNDFLEFTEKQSDEAVAALSDLALNFGVIQNDIRPDNFGLSPSTGKVVAFDFEDVIWNAPERAVQTYVQNLRRRMEFDCRI